MFGAMKGGAVADTYSAKTIAKWFIAWAEAEGADLSNLKLQKLLYYAQGWFVRAHRRPLFDDRIRAWSHGPVVPAVYHEYKHFGSGDIELPAEDEFDWSDVDSEATAVLIEVWNTYGRYSAWGLRNMTHREPPWQNHFEEGYDSPEIPAQEIYDYFVTLPARP